MRANQPLERAAARVMDRFDVTQRLVRRLTHDEAVIGGIGYTNFDLWATGRRPQQTGDQIERRRFTAAGFSQDCYQLAAPDREAEIAHGLERRAAVGARKRLADAFEFNFRRAVTSCVHSACSAKAR